MGAARAAFGLTLLLRRIVAVGPAAQPHEPAHKLAGALWLQ
jgi:hypothetical protein